MWTVDLYELPPLISVEEAGTILGMSRRTAYRHAEEGHIPTVRFGRRIHVPSAKLLALLGLESTSHPAAPDSTNV